MKNTVCCTALLLLSFGCAFAQHDSTALNFVNGFNFEGKTRNITFEKNGFPLEYRTIEIPLVGGAISGVPKRIRWKHLQHMIRLPDADSTQYYMGTFSRNCSATEGGLVFVAAVPFGLNNGKVIWCDQLTNRHTAGGYNHPGDLRRLGNTVVIAGQNWNGGEHKLLANSIDPMNQGNGGQHVLFYDVSNPAAPNYMGKINSCSDGNRTLTATKDIDELTAAKSGEYYYLWFNGYSEMGLACRSLTFEPDAVWELVKECNDSGFSPISFSLEGETYHGGAMLEDGVVYFNILQFRNNGNWEYRLNQLPDSIMRQRVVSSNYIHDIESYSNWDGKTFSVNSLSDGRSSLVIANAESNERIEIAEIESSNQYQTPVSDVYLYFHNNAKDVPGYTRIPVDLNQGAGGWDMVLHYKRDPCKQPITGIKILLQPRMFGPINPPPPPPNYSHFPCNRSDNNCNVNGDQGSYTIWMYYSRDPREGYPITDIDILMRKGKGNLLEKIGRAFTGRFDQFTKIFKDFDIENPIGFAYNVVQAGIPTEIRLLQTVSEHELGQLPNVYERSQWYRHTADLNKGAGGDDLWLLYSRTNGVAPSFLECPKNIEVSNDSENCGARVNLIPPKLRPDCAIESGEVTFTPASGSFFPIGATTVTCLVKDHWNPRDSLRHCQFTVTVNDLNRPGITCPAPVTVSCEASTAPNAVVAAVATDNCPTVLINYDYADETITGCCTPEFTIIRTWTARDISGNTNSCVQVIAVKDATAPNISCPAGFSVQCKTDVPALNPATASANDNCAVDMTITGSQGTLVDGACGGTITNTYTAADDCGNTRSCTQVIIVKDSTKPDITCPAEISVQCATDVPDCKLIRATANDNCDNDVTITCSQGALTGSNSNGSVINTYTATDDCGNTSSCTQKITVKDNTNPEITCPAGFSVQCATDVPACKPVNATATDNCDTEVSIACLQGTLAGTKCNGTITNTYTATDDNGNTRSCTQRITVKDETPPAITCPDPVTVASDTSVRATKLATAVDNCDASLDFSRRDVHISGDCDWYCTVERHFQAKDDCGNTSSCVQRITRNTAPIIETILPVMLGVSNSTVTIPVGRADCIIKWLPHTGTVPEGLDFKKIAVVADCKPGNNQLDVNGRLVNPLMAEALKLTIFVGLKPSLGTTKISTLGSCLSPDIMNYLAPNPDINELLRVTNMALGNIAAQPDLQKLLDALRCINAPLTVFE